jgi:VanZ like family
MTMTVAPAPHLRRAGLVITIVSLGAIAIATLPPAAHTSLGAHLCLVCGTLGGVNAVLNVILFVPLGVGLALCGLPGKRSLIAMCVLSVLIEAVQLTIPGRDSTIGDVVTNTLGGALGFAMGRFPMQWLRPGPRIARYLAVGWGALWIAIQAISNFGFAPSLTDSKYYGEIGRILGTFDVFPGRVLTSSIGELKIPDTAFHDSRMVRTMLLAGATIATTVVPAGSTRTIAPIVRVADTRRNEIVLLAQDRESFVFGIRTGAGVLRLRPPLFALPGVFAIHTPNFTGDNQSVTLSGRYVARGATMSVHRASAAYERTFALSASRGWILWLPFPWLIEETRGELIFGSAWLACLVIPLAYWSARISDPLRSRSIAVQSAQVLFAGFALLCVGLVGVPVAFGLSWAPVRDWIATLAGIMIGALASFAFDTSSIRRRADIGRA